MTATPRSPDPAALVRPEVRAEKAYRVPTEADAPAKLDQNESPFDLPADFKREVAERFVATDWNRYPDDRPHRLVAALADRMGVPREGVIVGHGSNEVTHTLGLCFVRAGASVVLPHPMFSLYESVARMYGGRVVGVDPDPATFGHSADDVIAAAQASEAALTVVTTPNNPTGQTFAHADLERMAREVPGVLVIDEAYVEFVGRPTAVDLVARYPQVLVMRTFSKAMGLAGLRIGYLVGDPRLIQEVEKARVPFLVDRFSESIALALLARPEIVDERVGVLTAERERMLGALAGVAGVETVGSAANFFLLRTPLAPGELAARLVAHGVRVRNVSGYAALGPDQPGVGWARVSVGTPAENRAFEAALDAVLTDAGVAEGAAASPPGGRAGARAAASPAA